MSPLLARLARITLRVLTLVIWAAPLITLAQSPSPAKGPILDVIYRETRDGQKLALDIFLPPSAATTNKARPAILMVHGGGWAGGDKKSFHSLAAGLAKLGYVSVPVAYRLTSNPANLWPAQLDDVQLAVRWLRAHADEYGIDPARVGAIGASAGGHLVTCLGLRESRDPAAGHPNHSSRVTCVINVNGPSDLTEDFAPKVKQGKFVNDLLKRLFGGPAAENPAAASDASPLQHITLSAPPFLIFHGRMDDVVPFDQSQRLHDALAKQGTPVKLLAFDHEGHAFQKPESQKIFLEETVRFFHQHLKP